MPLMRLQQCGDAGHERSFLKCGLTTIGGFETSAQPLLPNIFSCWMCANGCALNNRR